MTSNNFINFCLLVSFRCLQFSIIPKNLRKPLNKIIRETKGSKKFKVFVKDGEKIKTVRFGDANMSIKKDDPVRRKAFNDRMKPILAKVKGNKKLSPRNLMDEY